MKKFKLSILFVLLALFCKAGGGDYDISRLKEQYPDQIGVILSHEQIVTVNVNDKTGALDIFETDREEILYLKESAKYYTDQSISLSYFFEDILDYEAMSINSDGKKLKLKDEDFRVVDSSPSSWVFHDDNKELVFKLDELGEGYRSIIEYTKRIKRPEFFDVFHFVSGYPVLNSTVEITAGEGVNLRFFERAMDGLEVIKTEEVGRKGSTTYRWTLKNLEPVKTEEGSTNIKNHVPHLVAQIVSYDYEGKQEVLIEDLDDLHAYFEEFLLLKGDESNMEELNRVVDEITEGMSDPVAKMDTIFNWVQANIKYIAVEDGINGYVPRACSAVMKNRYGDCKDMGNLLVEMLSYAGVENAYVAWVGTRDIPYLMSEIPSPLTCNHVICVVEKKEKTEDGHKFYYLDATNPGSSYILPPMSIQEKELLIHHGEGEYELFKVPAAKAEDNYIRSVVEYTLTEGDSIYGRGVDYYGGYERENRAYYLDNLKDQDLKDYVKDLSLGGANRYTLRDFEIKGTQKKGADLEIHYDFAVDNLAIQDENEIILNPTLFKPRVTKYRKEDYKYSREKSRHRTIDYSYKLTIPENYVVKHLPEDVQFEHDLFQFNADFEQKGNQILVRMAYEYHLLEIPRELFEDWNAFSNSINSATIQNIILEPTKR